MTTLGTFYGVGVGPGPQGYVTVAAYEALKTCDLIFYPKATSHQDSVALHCIRGLEFPKSRFQEISFKMDPDRTVLSQHYTEVADIIAQELETGQHVGFLTLGDLFTYSTYSYTLAALKDRLPNLSFKSFAGINSFSAVASALSWPLAEGKERVLILPCPDEMESLKADIESHDVVILMKIGKRLKAVLELIQQLGIGEHCGFAKRVGFEEEVLCADVSTLDANETSLGYLSLLLIRKQPIEQRHL